MLGDILLVVGIALMVNFRKTSIVKKVAAGIMGIMGILFIMGFMVFIVFWSTDAFFDKKTKEIPIEVQIYTDGLEKDLERLNQNTWDVQVFFATRNFHIEAEQVIAPKKYFDAVDVHYMSITPELIDKFLESDGMVWNRIIRRQAEWDCEEWRRLCDEHQQIITKFKKIKGMYPKN